MVVMIGWIFFRSESFDQASIMLQHLVGFGDAGSYDPSLVMFLNGEVLLIYIVAIVCSTPVLHDLGQWLRVRSNEESESPSVYRALLHAMSTSIALVTVLALVFAKLASGTYDPFIYFRF